MAINEAGDLKSSLLDYLQMEHNCKRWYTCSMAYFTAAAQQVLPTLAAAHSNDARSGPPSSSKKGGIAPKTTWKRELSAFLEAELAKLREAVFAIPQDDSAAAIPALFSVFAGREEVELLD